MNIVLAGMPGSGKSTVADLLAKHGKTVFDTDALIVEEHGKISEIFEDFGEEYFRRLETETVKKLCALDGIVIATGGGCLLKEENVKYLKGVGKIVYLRARSETLIKRVQGDTTRPLLAGNIEEQIKRLYKERAAIYEGAADIIIDTDGLSPEQTIQRILRSLK
ncbi:MAG: shikimate kinase [Clostridia bacterium]|nr:shikimate kinase [Clostridia bacterium]